MVNKNDIPIGYEEIVNESKFNDFSFKKYFIKIGNLLPNKKKEKVDIEVCDKKFEKERGLVYCFVVDGKLLKVGQTITTMKKRVQSYNCGKQNYRDNGTCSTTNYFTLQSLLKINKIVEVYAYFIDKITINVFGKDIKEAISPKLYEKHILKELRDKDIFPIFCTQS